MSASLAMLCALFLSAALLYIALGIPFTVRRLRKDRSSGFEPPSMVREAAAWRAINAATGRDLIATGATLAPLAVVLWLTSASPVVFGMACAGWLLLGATGIVLHTFMLVSQHPH